ncbi:hypothetical protein HMJ29_17135 [Hymenobacter taeanensis]|uniref:Periplasmic heavy metal sensor n=1 Tax=Hymenobacter taeanensis TaxID=2735321 RepID=A0A6M6BKI6_9BACT|nr:MULTISPECIES: hypothetical protein [Hymenobacter]QJX48547.1 hypothetical protein HMJ29_17135 [Hymenobacter taeanensis]UOQ81956.1 hypothetical protein MUN83_03975 [Hymenobacter sp. 5414T-23]
MKKAYFFAFLMVGLQLASSATPNSEGDGTSSIKARATALTRTVAEKARLDEGQYLRLKQLNTQMLTEMDELKSRLAGDPAALDQRMADAQAKYEADLMGLLRPNQIALYQQARTSMTALGQTNH